MARQRPAVLQRPTGIATLATASVQRLLPSVYRKLSSLFRKAIPQPIG